MLCILSIAFIEAKNLLFNSACTCRRMHIYYIDVNKLVQIIERSSKRKRNRDRKCLQNQIKKKNEKLYL